MKFQLPSWLRPAPKAPFVTPAGHDSGAIGIRPGRKWGRRGSPPPPRREFLVNDTLNRNILRNTVLVMGDLSAVPTEIMASAEAVVQITPTLGARVVKNRRDIDGWELRLYADRYWTEKFWGNQARSAPVPRSEEVSDWWEFQVKDLIEHPDWEVVKFQVGDDTSGWAPLNQGLHGRVRDRTMLQVCDNCGQTNAAYAKECGRCSSDRLSLRDFPF